MYETHMRIDETVVDWMHNMQRDTKVKKNSILSGGIYHQKDAESGLMEEFLQRSPQHLFAFDGFK